MLRNFMDVARDLNLQNLGLFILLCVFLLFKYINRRVR